MRVRLNASTPDCLHEPLSGDCGQLHSRNCRSIADFSDQCSPKIVDEWRSIRESKEFVGTSRPRFSCLIKFPYGLDSSATEMGNDDLQKTMFVAAGDPGNPQLSGLEAPYPNQVGKDC